jgi:hypothetical protein
MMKASLLQIEYHAEITFNMDIHQQNIRKCSCRSAKSRFGSYQYLSTVYVYRYTVTKAKPNAGAKHKGDGKFTEIGWKNPSST